MEQVKLIVLFFVIGSVCGHRKYHDDAYGNRMHPSFEPRVTPDEESQTSEYWNKLATERVILQNSRKPNKNAAKNVVFFLGDGMSIPTLAATRAYIGQQEGVTGEEVELSFDKFSVTGLAKTYCVDRQVADSACTATAYLTGVKANYGTIGVNGKVPRYDCQKMQDASNHVESIAKDFLKAGKSVGVVTTTRITHASPAGVYAHTANRDWENDGDVMSGGENPEKCRDIAYQLVHGEPGKFLTVILGGGRREFLPNTTIDEEGQKGSRWDGKNLIEEWKAQKAANNKTSTYVWNRAQLKNDSSSADYLLGLFESDHCQYHLEGSNITEPTFSEMVEAAIDILSKNEKGFFLFAEGGRIDHAHHETYARLALDETSEFSKAIGKATEITSINDTLVIVTSDHAHTMSYSGYATRGNSILGASDVYIGADGLPYLTLNYANGPGYRKEVDGKRVDVTKENMKDPRFRYPSIVPLESETHGGDDVGVFAHGPWEHLFTGVYEQNTIPHLIKFATCMDKDFSACNSAQSLAFPIITTLISFFIAKCLG